MSDHPDSTLFLRPVVEPLCAFNGFLFSLFRSIEHKEQKLTRRTEISVRLSVGNLLRAISELVPKSATFKRFTERNCHSQRPQRKTVPLQRPSQIILQN